MSPNAQGPVVWGIGVGYSLSLKVSGSSQGAGQGPVVGDPSPWGGEINVSFCMKNHHHPQAGIPAPLPAPGNVPKYQREETATGLRVTERESED